MSADSDELGVSCILCSKSPTWFARDRPDGTPYQRVKPLGERDET